MGHAQFCPIPSLPRKYLFAKRIVGESQTLSQQKNCYLYHPQKDSIG